MADERNDFISNGWRQFCIVRPNDHESLCKLAHVPISENDLLLVITQTCDLVNTVEKEPFFEVACLHPLKQEPSNEFQFGRNSRRIELDLNVDSHKRHYYISAHERFPVPHEILCEIKPYDFIDDEDTNKVLVKWITSRYSRTAFPEEYENRWKARRKPIEKIIKKELQKVQDIYIRLSSFEELGASEEYELTIILLMDAENYDSDDYFKETEKSRNKLESEFNKCTGIHLESIDIISNAGIYVKELAGYARWDYSYLSYRDPEHHDSLK